MDCKARCAPGLCDLASLLKLMLLAIHVEVSNSIRYWVELEKGLEATIPRGHAKSATESDIL